ncbi:MAG TPA: hypothetical protein VMM77_12865 [Gemmatimonadaceae bacterium]|nr:hypothetical protein [Gemmatimonadaceae bacterium]
MTRWCLAAAMCVAAAFPLGAQEKAAPVYLRIDPRVGDTIRTRLEQQTEMRATARLQGEDSITTIRSWMATVALLRHVVEGGDARGTMLLTIIDSVAMSGEGVSIPSEQQRRILQGRSVRTRISPEGATDLLEGGDAVTPDVAAMFSSMPATLPDYSVSAGESWTKAMRVPIYPQAPGKPEAMVHAAFRLDSVRVRTSEAFISMRGVITRDVGAQRVEGKSVDTIGTIIGGMVVNAQRGWITDSRTTITVKSQLLPASPESAPMQFQLRMTQRMHAIDRR